MFNFYVHVVSNCMELKNDSLHDVYESTSQYNIVYFLQGGPRH